MALESYSKLHLQITDDGTVSAWNGQLVSAQKQVRYLRQELSNTTYNDAQRQSVRLLLADAERGMEATKARSKELFGQLALIPGPIGQVAAQANQAYIAFRSLSQLNFEDLKSTLKIMKESILGTDEARFRKQIGEGGIIGEAPGKGAAAGAAAGAVAGAAVKTGSESIKEGVANAIPEIMDLRDEGLKTAKDFGVLQSQLKSLDAQLANSGNFSVGYKKQIQDQRNAVADLIATKKQNLTTILDELSSYEKYADANGKLIDATNHLKNSFKDTAFVIKDGNIFIGEGDKGLRQLSEAELKAAQSGKQLAINTEGEIIALKGLTLSEQIATIATKALTAALYGLIAVLGIMVAMEIWDWFKMWIQNTKEATIETERLATQIKTTNDVMDLSLQDQKRRGEETIAMMKAVNKSDKEINDEKIRLYKQTWKTIYDGLQEAKRNEAAAEGNYGPMIAEVKKRLDAAKILYADDKASRIEAERVYNNEIKNLQQQQEAADKVRLGGVSSEVAEKRKKNYDEAVKARQELEKKLKDVGSAGIIEQDQIEEQYRKNARANRLRDNEAAIENEIRSADTNGKKLAELIASRNAQVDEENAKRGLALQDRERILRNYNDAKKINDAIVEDTVRRIDKEIELNDERLLYAGKGTDEEYKLKIDGAKLIYDKEMELAKKAGNDRANAEQTAKNKHVKALFEIDKQYYADKLALDEANISGSVEKTTQMFDLERQREQDAYRLKALDAKNNYEMLEALKIAHEKAMADIDLKEQQNEAEKTKKKAAVENQNYAQVEDRFFKSFKVIKELNDRKYKDLNEAENIDYEARKKNIQDTVKDEKDRNEMLKQLELEHVQTVADLKVQEKETRQQIDRMMIAAAANTGRDLMTIGDVLMQEKQGKDKAAFEAGKKLAVAGIVVQKAAAVAEIWENNAIANAKAVAAFPLTMGQPWVTINTIMAGISTAATIAAAAQGISQINGTQFETTKAKTGNGLNFGAGGVINGERHAQGGVMINAEGGEAVMTRGAVTAFGPLLSLMNQMGGGTSFNPSAVGNAKFDVPQTAGGVNEPQILKTYVVENELTTIQARQARLKDLSTL